MTTRDDILTALLAADPLAALKAHDTAELHARFARAQVRLKNVDKSRFVDAGAKKYNFAPLDEFLSMARAELGDYPLGLASGVSVDNVERVLGLIDYAIVGTSLKSADDPLRTDAARVRGSCP
jgi:hypothetical protein